MAQLDTGGGKADKGGKVRSKKQNSSVDLTAMVDLAFLLITFFMLTTSLSKPQSMDLAMPDKDEKIKDDILISEERTMNLVLGGDNKLVMYMGQITKPLEGPKDLTYSKESLRKEILAKSKSVPLATRNTDKPNGDPLIVLIKASDKATYTNLVDVLDEMAIGKIQVYAIVDIVPQELQLLGE